ncbi:MAG: hypothetical protein SGJ19_01220 [Planctomycetia bacterium]|nr:hypothetical protein [Planctomycetia bacterium]
MNSIALNAQIELKYLASRTEIAAPLQRDPKAILEVGKKQIAVPAGNRSSERKKA